MKFVICCTDELFGLIEISGGVTRTGAKKHIHNHVSSPEYCSVNKSTYLDVASYEPSLCLILTIIFHKRFVFQKAEI